MTTTKVPAAKRLPSEPRVGTFADTAIRELGLAGRLVVENFDARNIKQACYELRASTTYYLPPDDAPQEATDYILIKPRQLTVIITQESLDLPSDVIGRILTKGQLFSIGLLPVNTYADPGFIGQLGIVLHNVSNSYIKIRPGDTIAKIEFSRLEHPVQSPYRGQHGYQTKIWPIPRTNILSDDEMRQAANAGRIGSPGSELEQSFGKPLASLFRRVLIFQRWLVGSTAIYFLCTLSLIAFSHSEMIRSVWLNLALGVLGNAIFGLIMAFGPSLRGR